MSTAPGTTPAKSLLFGPFRLLPAQSLLLENDKPVRIGQPRTPYTDCACSGRRRACQQGGTDCRCVAEHDSRRSQPSRSCRRTSQTARGRSGGCTLYCQRGWSRLSVHCTGVRGRRAAAVCCFAGSLREQSQFAGAPYAHGWPLRHRGRPRGSFAATTIHHDRRAGWDRKNHGGRRRRRTAFRIVRRRYSVR